MEALAEQFTDFFGLICIIHYYGDKDVVQALKLTLV